MTLRDLLVEELRRREVVVLPEMSFKALDGRHLMPDLVLKDGAQYVVETKLGPETKLLDAMVQLYDYSKNVTTAKGAFAVLFPEELRKPWPSDVIVSIAKNAKTQLSAIGIFKDLRPSQPFKGSLFEVADWIAGHVLKPLVVEADTGFAIRILRDAVDYITASVKQLQSRELEDIFGGKSVFENVLQYEEGRYPLEEMRRAVAYLLINQLLFYHVLTRVDASFAAVDEDKVRRPSDLQQYFDGVLRRDYSSVFGFDVASRLPDSAVDIVRKVVIAVKAVAPEKIRHDLLGKVFHELIPFDIRKAVAAFYTNNEAAEILAQLAIDKADAKVIDLACGSGTLLVAAYRRKQELLKREKGGFTLEDHKRFLEEDLTGIDIMPFAAHMAVVHLSLQALAAGHETEKVRIAVWDSTELKPEQTIPAISRELKVAYKRPTLEIFMEGRGPNEDAYIEKGALTLEGIGGEQIPLEKADIVIMNPPFTRQQRIPREYKGVLAKRFSKENRYLHGQMGYHGYFMILANRFLKNEGRLALVLPASVLNADGFLKIRELLTSHYHIEHVITTWQRAAFSENAQFREILLIARKKASVPANAICTVTELKSLPRDFQEAKKIVEKIKKISKIGGCEITQDENLQVSTFTMKELKNTVDNIFKVVALTDKRLVGVWQSIIERAEDELVAFGKYLDKYGGGPWEGAALGQIIKGGGIGAFYVHRNSSKMLKKTDLWVIKETTKNKIIAEHKALKIAVPIPLDALHSAMRRFSGFNTFDISNDLDYIVADSFPNAKTFFESSPRIIDSNSLAKWKSYVNGLLGNLFLANHVDVSAAGTSILAYYSNRLALVPRSMWSIKIPDVSAKVFTLWLNSSLNLLQLLLLRRETRGAYIWFVASTIRKFLVPNIDKLLSEDVERLLQIFSKYCAVKFPDIISQLKSRFSPRAEIDMAILKILGFSDDEINQFLDYLYPALAKEIEQLKTLMEG